MECDALEGRLLFIRLQILFMTESGLVSDLMKGNAFLKDEWSHLMQPMREAVVGKILRATVHRHLTHEIEVAEQAQYNALSDTPSERARLESAIWKYLSMAETALATIELISGAPQEYTRELAVVEPMLVDALIGAGTLCGKLGRDGEEELYGAQADAFMGSSESSDNDSEPEVAESMS